MKTIGFKSKYTKRFIVQVSYKGKNHETYVVYAISEAAAIETVRIEYEGAYGIELAWDHVYEVSKA